MPAIGWFPWAKIKCRYIFIVESQIVLDICDFAIAKSNLILHYKFQLSERKSIFYSAFWVSLGTLITRVIGLAREIAMAAAFGTTVAADAFIVAWRFPNLFRYVFGENSFTAAFLPKFTEIKHKEGPEAAFAMASAILTALLSILVVVCVLGVAFAPHLIRVIVIGWHDDPQRLFLATKLVRILFLFIGFLGLGSYCQAILNTYRKFFVSSVAPAFTNLSWLIGVGLATFFFTAQTRQIQFVAASVVFGGFLFFLWQFIWVLKLGWRFKWAIKGHKREVIEVGLLLLPSLLSLATHEINYLADVMLASLLPGGSVSSLAYAMRLVYLPLALLGYAVATASLPNLSEAAARDDNESFNRTLSMTVRSIFTVLAPIALATIVLRFEVVSLIFERGSFAATSSTPMVAWALLFYVIGLPFHGITRTMQQAFYARKDTRTPVYITGLGVVFNIELSMIFMFSLDHGGLALGSSLTGLINSCLLIFYMGKRLDGFNIAPIIKTELQVLGAAAVAALATWLFKTWINPMLVLNIDFVTKLLQFFIPAGFFFGIFFAMSKVLGIQEVAYAWKRVFNRLKGRFSNL